MTSIVRVRVETLDLLTVFFVLFVVGAEVTQPDVKCLSGQQVGLCVSLVSGDITSLQIIDRHVDGGVLSIPLRSGSGTVVQGCNVTSHVEVSLVNEPLSLSVKRLMQCHYARTTVTVVDTFQEEPTWDSIRWTQHISSAADYLWTTPVASVLLFDVFDVESHKAWIAGPRFAALPNSSYGPLQPFSVGPTSPVWGPFYYGGRQNDINGPKQISAPSAQLPMLSVLINVSAQPFGVSLVQDPNDTPIVAYATVAPLPPAGSSVSNSAWGAELAWTRTNHRLGAGSRAIQFSADLISHPHCWRPAVAWMQRRHASFFEPNEAVNIANLDGPGSYADLRGPPDMNSSVAPQYAAMAYTFNWDASARFPFHGEWAPTAMDGFGDNGTHSNMSSATWTSCFAHEPPDGYSPGSCGPVGYTQLRTWYKNQRQQGFHTCVYGNLFEFGWNVSANWPQLGHNTVCHLQQQSVKKRLDPTDTLDLTCHSHDLLKRLYGNALVSKDRGGTELLCGGLDGSCVMDPHPSLPYAQHLLDMTTTSLSASPAEGVCVDRQDWLGYVNPRADDGVTLLQLPSSSVPVPVRALISSWKPAMALFADAWHKQGRPVLINDHSNRLDMMQHVDGIYAEMADVTAEGWTHGFGSGLAAMSKPVVLWNHPKPANISHGVLDAALQAHLYAGVYPTIPMHNNDHSIGGDCAPNCPYDIVYEQYAPLFRVLRGKRWLLTTHAIETSAGQANAFVTEVGFVGVIVAVDENDSAAGVTVTMRLPHGDGVRVGSVSQLRPGMASRSLQFSHNGEDAVIMELPPFHGCSVLVLSVV